MPTHRGAGLKITANKLTVAGQTAPGGGICFHNNCVVIKGNDLIFRHLRWRIGKVQAHTDSIDFDGTKDIIFDHCDMMFGTDENMSSFAIPADNLTYQWSINAWGLQTHSCGGLWPVQHGTVHHTLWANNHTRNPKLIGPDVFDWINNVTFGWDLGFNMAANKADGTTHRINVLGSSFIHGGRTGNAFYGGGKNSDGSLKFKLHMADSAMDGSANGILDVTKTNYEMVTGNDYDKSPTPWAQTADGSPANSLLGVPTAVEPRMTAYKKIVSQVGAARMEIDPATPLRDEFTQEAVNRLVGMKRSIIADPLELGLPCGPKATLKSVAAPVDSDRDGMPDYWENALGFNPAVDDHNTVFSREALAASFFPAGTPAGYTYLEEYLHFLAVPHGVVAKNTAENPGYLDIDLRKFTSGFTANPVFTVSNITGGAATSSGPGNALVRFTPTRNTSGRAGFLFKVTDAEGSSWTQQVCILVLPKPLSAQHPQATVK